MSARSTPNGESSFVTPESDSQEVRSTTVAYRPLPTEFRAKGWSFHQLARVGDVALFEKSHAEVTRSSYEVVVVQRHDARTIAGREIPAAEAMPGTEMWGRAGWSFMTYEIALDRFDRLVAERAGGAA